MTNEQHSLESKTQIFWKMSQVWNNKRNVNITTGEAIEICTTMQEILNPYRPLARCNDRLLQEIIQGQGKKVEGSKILKFARS